MIHDRLFSRTKCSMGEIVNPFAPGAPGSASQLQNTRFTRAPVGQNARDGPESIAAMTQLRNYTGSPVPLPLQAVAEKAWAEETHVSENRALYQEKYALADSIFDGLNGYVPPEAGFFLWMDVGDGEAATLKLWKETGVRVLPGEYLAQTVDGHNPGKSYIRVAMVAPRNDLERGLKAIRACLFEQG